MEVDGQVMALDYRTSVSTSGRTRSPQLPSEPGGALGTRPRQDAANACLTCPDFQTTPEFLDIHRKQSASNKKLIARADANGQFRFAENLRQVQDSLDNIIPALEKLDGQ